MNQVRALPCEFCPYKKSVPSGVWSADDYDKLPQYDRPTGEQPFEPFACHVNQDFYCHGWAVVHNSRGHEYELLALRIFGSGEAPESRVPLFASGTEAAEHGKRDIARPSSAARRAIAKLLARYARLRGAR